MKIFRCLPVYLKYAISVCLLEMSHAHDRFLIYITVPAYKNSFNDILGVRINF